MDARPNRRFKGTRHTHQDLGDYTQQPEAMGDARARKPELRRPRHTEGESDAEPDTHHNATHVDVIKSLVGLIANGGRRNKSEVKHAQFDGTKWEAFRTQFEKAANMNKWTDEEKASRLCCSLTGSALTFLHNPGVTDWPYEKLMTQMDKRFGCATADLNQIVEASKFVMGPKEPVMRFADRINESFAKSTMSPEARNSFCWFAFMQGLGKYHKEMRTHVRKETKKQQDYQLALYHAEEYAREYSPIADEEETDTVDANAALVAQLAETLHAKKQSSRTPKAPAKDALEKADKRLVAMVREFTTTEGDETESTDVSSEIDAKVDAVEERLDSTVSRVCQILLNQKPNNHVKLKTTKPIPSTGHADKRIEALTDKLLALETAVEEREKNRLQAIERRQEKEKSKRSGNGNGDNKPRKNNRDNYRRRDDYRRDDYDNRRRSDRRRDDSRGRSRGRSPSPYRSRDRSYRRHDDNRRPAPPAQAPQASVNANHA